ncbi:nucleoside recognition domain-containing protein [Halothermothrix orenii]|uniref:Ferrous iron transport protein FeoB n=1 Tax=Halothermothrix orenii (strain H 168 / OCM 544 / DSM 9562) TaxID=373903 RepID=B8D2C2_HALOH|nr:nucleoside recognition domain-containing protein [Halothermothrix orenii]ACL69349.1 Ferrous iron transport protein FeoB [Halothermothrix orenii H 168]
MKAFLKFEDPLERSLQELSSLFKKNYPVSHRALVLMVLSGDKEIEDLISRSESDNLVDRIKKHKNKLRKDYGYPLEVVISKQRKEKVKKVVGEVLKKDQQSGNVLKETIDFLTINPYSGPVILAIVLIGLYYLVGVVGARYLVDFIEKNFFIDYFNPLITEFIEMIIPYRILQELFVGDYGIFTLALRYAIALVLPIVGCFFLAFSILEDSGYFPRIAVLSNKILKVIGLNGRAVIPILLGFGCGTMATIATRVLERKRERILVTFLLALAIPCSSQMGLISGILAGNPVGLLIWVIVVGAVFTVTGYLLGLILPGRSGAFYMELTELRIPRPVHIIKKTVNRMRWYFLEVVPLFIYASFFIWIGRLTGLFERFLNLLHPVVRMVGLPGESAVIFLYGFFRRDYGAAGLYDLYRSGVLNNRSLIVVSVILTLFVPCVAHFSMIIRERGLITGLVITGLVFIIAFTTGYILNNIFFLLNIV